MVARRLRSGHSIIESAGVEFLALESEWDGSYREELLAEPELGLWINAWWFPYSSLQFLSEPLPLRHLRILGTRRVPVPSLGCHESLITLGLSNVLVEHVAGQDFPSLLEINGSGRDLEPILAAAPKLVDVKWGGIPDESLSRWLSLIATSVEILELSESRRLTDLSPLASWPGSLRSLSLFDLGKQRDWDWLGTGATKNISRLSIYGSRIGFRLATARGLVNLEELELENCRSVGLTSDLLPFRKLRSLKVYGQTEFEDDDLRTLLDLPNLQNLFIELDRRRYHPRASEVESQIKSRRGEG